MSTNININPELWGQHAWKFMHYITLSYPDNPTDVDKLNIYNFFSTISRILPCDKCRYNFSEHQKQYPLNNECLSSKYNLTNWLLNIHNNVNIATNKPIMSYDEFIILYNPINTNSSYLDTKTLTIIFIVVLILILLLILRIKHRNSKQ